MPSWMITQECLVCTPRGSDWGRCNRTRCRPLGGGGDGGPGGIGVGSESLGDVLDEVGGGGMSDDGLVLIDEKTSTGRQRSPWCCSRRRSPPGRGRRRGSCACSHEGTWCRRGRTDLPGPRSYQPEPKVMPSWMITQECLSAQRQRRDWGSRCNRTRRRPGRRRRSAADPVGWSWVREPGRRACPRGRGRGHER